MLAALWASHHSGFLSALHIVNCQPRYELFSRSPDK